MTTVFNILVSLLLNSKYSYSSNLIEKSIEEINEVSCEEIEQDIEEKSGYSLSIFSLSLFFFSSKYQIFDYIISLNFTYTYVWISGQSVGYECTMNLVHILY